MQQAFSCPGEWCHIPCFPYKTLVHVSDIKASSKFHITCIMVRFKIFSLRIIYFNKYYYHFYLVVGSLPVTFKQQKPFPMQAILRFDRLIAKCVSARSRIVAQINCWNVSCLCKLRLLVFFAIEVTLSVTRFGCERVSNCCRLWRHN